MPDYRPEVKKLVTRSRLAAADAAADKVASVASKLETPKSGIAGNNSIAGRRRKRIAAVSAELNDIFFRYPFSVPEYFALITRALIVLEGIALTGQSDFDIFSAA